MNAELFADLMESVRDMGRHMRGEEVAGVKVIAPDIKALRDAASVSQAEFARLIGVSRRTLENWEQGRTTPSGAARALLKIVAADPGAAIRALHVTRAVTTKGVVQ
jgi:putative transcriptional regulator